MKIGNPEWEKIWPEPTDITLRNRVGKSFAPDDAASIGDSVEHMLASQPDWAQKIEAVRGELISNVGHGGEAAGEYLLSAMLAKQEERNAASAD